jgi:hypothetical protein
MGYNIGLLDTTIQAWELQLAHSMHMRAMPLSKQQLGLGKRPTLRGCRAAVTISYILHDWTE